MLKWKNISVRRKLFLSFLLVSVLSVSFLLVEYPPLGRFGILRLYFISGCIILLGVSLAFAMANATVGNLRKLQDAMRDIADGNFKVRIDIDSADQTGQLVQAFNRMAEQLMNMAAPINKPDGEMSQQEDVEQKLMRLNQDLCTVVDRLDESNRDLRHLTYVASHDLSEPLRKICCFGRLLQDSAQDKLDDDERENLSFMIDAADRMLERMDGIRAYSGIIGEAYPTDCVDLKQIIDELTETEFSPLIKTTDALITICEPLPKVCANRSQIQMLLRHIISNALEYHRQETRPAVTIRSAPQQDGMVRIEVEDNGIGITKEDFDTIFAMFKRLHPQQKHKGAGIGLSLCKKIVERHGGTIGVTSEYGRGATFWFTLPAIRAYSCKQNEPWEQATTN